MTIPDNVCTSLSNTAHVSGGGAAEGGEDSNTVITSVTGCTRTVTLVKLMKDGSGNAQTFSGTILNDLNGFTGLQVSTLISQNPQSHTESSSQTHDVTETPQAGFVLDGYQVIPDTTSAGRCFPNSEPTTTLSSTAPIPADGQDYLVCIVNHPAQGRLIIEKDNVGGDSADVFTADITGGTQNIPFSEDTPSTPETLPVGGVTVHEDPKTGYTYLGFTEGHCVPPVAQVADLVIREDAVATAGDFTGTIVDGQDTIVCFHNQKTRHVTIIKNVDNAGQICDQTLFPIVEDSQTANSQVAGDISDCGTTIETDVDTLSHTFTETPLPNGYTFVDSFESDANCTPVEQEIGTAVGNTYVLDAGSDDVTICFVNHKPQGTLVIKKVNIDGIQTDVFTADIGGGEQDIQFSASGLGPATRTLVPAAYSVSEDPLSGYTYLGFALGNVDGNCSPDPANANPGSTANDVTIVDNQTTTICFYNDGIAHIQVNKIDLTGNTPGKPASWLFDVTGPVNDLAHSIALGGGSYTIDVPLGTYTATETNGDFSACPTVNESGAWRSQALTATQQTLTTPGQTIVFTFQNAACDIVAGTGNLIIEKYSDFSADHAINGSDQLLNGWTVTVTGPEFPGGQTFVTGANGNPFGTIVLSGIADGSYTVTETNQAGYTVVGVVNVNTSTFTAGTTGSGSVADGETTTIRFFNQPKVNIHVTKTEIANGTTNPGNGWTVTLTGCGVNESAVTASGVADFTDLDLCANYVVSENPNSKTGFTPAGPTSVTVVATTAGNTYTVNFTNTLIQVCTSGCAPTTPTPTPVTPTPTNTPTATPTARPTNTPTATPTNTPINNVEGAKTPGPGTTPIAPSTGTGIFGSTSSSINVLLALCGLFALSGGLATMAFARRRHN